APYRLSMAVNLPALGPLASVWKPVLAGPLTEAAGRGLVVDCRSSTYAAAWTPTGALAERWVQVKVPGATHMAKHTRGLVARALCEEGADPRRVTALPDVLGDRFEVQLHEAAGAGRPWVLEATAR
ncbi:MAG TPA: peroxide stress protein YaaA, partial [Pedococcus sp.]|nr:peroxide stress protein YaaA [Pedococcus sp.]